jgi:hypothetical protein
MSSSSGSFHKKYPYGRCQMRGASGDPCRMPAVHGELCCHYHKVMGQTAIRGGDEFLPYDHIYLPRLEDAPSIQAAISEVCELMLHRRIEPKEASALFYAMQVASQNLPSQNLPPLNQAPVDAAPAPDSPPPGAIQACAEQPPRRRPGRPRKTIPQLVHLNR